MAALGSLSSRELRAVEAACRELSSGQVSQQTSSSSSRRFRAKHGKAKKKKKGPTQTKSVHAAEPLYVAFKATDKKLRRALRESKMTLREAQESEDLDERTSVLLADFTSARQDWWVRKAQLQVESSTAESSPWTSDHKWSDSHAELLAAFGPGDSKAG